MLDAENHAAMRLDKGRLLKYTSARLRACLHGYCCRLQHTLAPELWPVGRCSGSRCGLIAASEQGFAVFRLVGQQPETPVMRLASMGRWSSPSSSHWRCASWP